MFKSKPLLSFFFVLTICQTLSAQSSNDVTKFDKLSVNQMTHFMAALRSGSFSNKQLELAGDQIARIDELLKRNAELAREFQMAMAKRRLDEPGANLDDLAEDYVRKMEVVKREVEAVLLPHQKVRLDQLVVQRTMRTNRSDSFIAVLKEGRFDDLLGLTSEQKEKLSELEVDLRSEAKKLYEKFISDTKAIGKKYDELGKDILTDEQRTKLDELIGDDLYENPGK